MYGTGLTINQYVKSFARKARPIFVANGWEWNGWMVPHKKIPNIEEIEMMTHHLIQSLSMSNEKGEEAYFNSCGRITVICNDPDDPQDISLSLSLI